MQQEEEIAQQLRRIADALEGKHTLPTAPDDSADAWCYEAESHNFRAVQQVHALPLELLKGIDDARDTLLENTRRFAEGLPANNALLWGARGTGKSSLVKAVHRALNEETPHAICLIEIAREEIHALPELMQILRGATRRYLLLCDDLSFDAGDTTYKSLKSVLDGGLEGRPENVLLYATSNRRHLMPREMAENEQRASLQPGEAIEEKVSLSDRFGLWLGFHHLDQPTYLDIVTSYRDHFELPVPDNTLHTQALEWATTRGGRSGRVAWQFIVDIAGQTGRQL